jgi:5'-3' exonuclease
MRIHLVDGTYELFRAYFGAPKRADSRGREVGAVIGLLSTLAALLRDPSCTHVAVAFDHVIESFRNRLFEGYKDGSGVEPELLEQFEPAERAARALGLVVWPMVDFEADDALATGAARWRADGRQVVLCSPDKDLAQCVRSDLVVCWDRRRDIVLDEPGVVAKFGVGPDSIADWLALVGDSADGIPGVPRWGAKTSSAVLARYRHIEEIPDDPDTWELQVRGARGLSDALEAHRDLAVFYRTLATLRLDVPLAERLEDLEWRGVPAGELDELCRTLGADELPESLGLPDARC